MSVSEDKPEYNYKRKRHLKPHSQTLFYTDQQLNRKKRQSKKKTSLIWKYPVLL